MFVSVNQYKSLRIKILWSETRVFLMFMKMPFHSHIPNIVEVFTIQFISRLAGYWNGNTYVRRQ